MSEFVHLHLHSEGSLLDGMCRTSPLLQRALQQKTPALAITDHGVMYRCIEFYREARDSGVKPILGCEVYVAPGSRFEKTGRGSGNYYHLILLAKDLEGYRNLMRLVSRGHLEGFYYKPRVDRETLAEFSSGLICLSACLGAEVPQLIMQEKIPEARRAAEEHLEIFGRGNYYFELQDHGIPSQFRVNEVLGQFSRELDIPVVATNDVHYVCPEDHGAHELLLCIQTGATLTDPKRFKFESDQFYLASAEEMDQKFHMYPDALKNTLRIAEMCNVDLDFDQVSLPSFPVPPGETSDTYLLQLCREGLPRRFPEAKPEHLRRLDYELSVINEKGFAPYFLIVADFVKHAEERGISVRARGSAAGSIVAYLLGVTSVDPLRHNLMFERFLNPDRVEMPDIDLDFSDVRRDEMIDYAIAKYGKDHVAQIGTLGTLGARAAIRDAGRSLGVPLPDVDRISKLIQGLNPTIEGSLEAIPELQRLYRESSDVQMLIDRAKSVEGVVRTSGIHAAGVVISRDPLTDCVPLQRGGKEGWACTQYDMDSVSRIGLLKVDLLGLRNLTVVDQCLATIRERRGFEIDIDLIPEEDAATFEMLKGGHGTGVFQLESSGMRQMIKALKPQVFDDLVPVVALYRPGPLQSGMVDQFIECRHGRRKVTYLDPKLEPILCDTYGVMLYQEQIMQISMQIGGFPAGDAEKLRKAMSKKIAELMAKFEDKFVQGAVANGVKEDIARTIFEQMANFAAYGFNKAHSAAYGALAYQTAYLKANYPDEYMAALLTSLNENKDRLSSTIEECRRMGLSVLPPDINVSAVDFSPEPGKDKSIRFGLGAIKGLSSTAIEGILQQRSQGGPFQSLFEFCERCHEVDALNKGGVEALIRAGAFQSIHPSRRQLIENLDVALTLRQQARRNAQSGQVTLFGLLGAAQEAVAPRINDPVLRPTAEYQSSEILGFEKDLLGLYVSSHPLHAYRKSFQKNRVSNIGDLNQFNERDSVVIGGSIFEMRSHRTRKGDAMMFATLEDLTGRVDVVLFKEALDQHQSLMEKGRVLIVHGKVSIRSGRGPRGGGEQGDDGETRVYSLLADRIIPAEASESDLDPFAEQPEESAWGLTDGGILDVWGAAEPDPDEPGAVEEAHWSTAALGALAPGLFADELADGAPSEPVDSAEQELAAPAALREEPVDSLQSSGCADEQSLPAEREEYPEREPMAPAPEQREREAAPAASSKEVDPPDDSTIRDIYGALPERGKPPVRLYPSAQETNLNDNKDHETASSTPKQAKPITADPPRRTPPVDPASGGRPAPSKTVYVTLQPEQTTLPILREVAGLLEQYGPGPHPVELQVATPDGRLFIRSNGSGGVQRSPELIRLLKERLGERAVRVQT